MQELPFSEVTKEVDGACGIDVKDNRGSESTSYQKDYHILNAINSEVACADICSQEKRCLAYQYAVGKCVIYFSKPNVVDPMAGTSCKYKVNQ
eukprot:Awhi_evm1s7822